MSWSASSVPAFTVDPFGAVAGLSSLTMATGICLRFPYGSQNAHRYSAPYSSGISVRITSASRDSSARLNRRSSNSASFIGLPPA